MLPKETKYFYRGVNVQQNGNPNTSYSLSWLGAAGAIISSVTDLNQYYQALFVPSNQGGLLDVKQLNELTALVAMKHDSQYRAGDPISKLDYKTFWGYGLGVAAFLIPSPDNQPTIFYNHSGGSMGFASNWVYQKDRRALLIWNFNSTDRLTPKVEELVSRQLMAKLFTECGINN